MHPNLLAEGAASGTPASLINSLTIVLSGNLIPIVGPLAVHTSGTHYFLGRTMVSGPGQKFLIRISRIYLLTFDVSAISLIYFGSQICIIKGSFGGLSFLVKIYLHAFASRPFAASPYTVSVGIPISYPCLINCAHLYRLISSGGTIGIEVKITYGCVFYDLLWYLDHLYLELTLNLRHLWTKNLLLFLGSNPKLRLPS